MGLERIPKKKFRGASWLSYSVEVKELLLLTTREPYPLKVRCVEYCAKTECTLLFLLDKDRFTSGRLAASLY